MRAPRRLERAGYCKLRRMFLGCQVPLFLYILFFPAEASDLCLVILGGSWLVCSMSMNDWPTVNRLVYGDNVTLFGWLLDLNLVIPGGVNVRSTENQLYYDSILGSVIAKGQTGMSVNP
jgi:hypothetical protein